VWAVPWQVDTSGGSGASLVATSALSGIEIPMSLSCLRNRIGFPIRRLSSSRMSAVSEKGSKAERAREDAESRALPRPPIIFHPEYSIPWPEKHRFAMWKFKGLADIMVKEGYVQSQNDFHVPELPPDEWFLSVHDASYYREFVDGTLAPELMRRTGFSNCPDHQELVKRTKLEVAGSVLAARLAIEHGLALHLGGGTHHAHSNWGAGYTCLNDLAVAARRMQIEGLANKVLIVDLDVHQGDGTAEIFTDDSSVYTLSMHCSKNFPFGFTAKSLQHLGHDKSDLDIGLDIGTTDAEYMAQLKENLPRVIDEFQPDLLLYIGGVDVWEGDALGKLQITEDGIFERDHYVVESALKANIPTACVIGGGYDQNREALSQRHSLVFRAALQAWDELSETRSKHNPLEES